MHRLIYSQLNQVRENSVNPAVIYQSAAGQTAQLFIKIANVTAAAASVRVFHDANGTTYDETTAVIWDMLINPGEILEIDHLFINDSSGRVAYRSSIANALTATVYGVIR